MKVVFRIKNLYHISEHELENGSSIIVGRTEAASIKINDHEMSSAHLRITLRNGKLLVVDLESKNGTYINGVKSTSGDIYIGDEIKIGRTAISLVPENMDEESVKALTFPGDLQERLSSHLKLDFTGARVLQARRPGSNPRPLTTKKKPLKK